jgi:hypothetical protein
MARWIRNCFLPKLPASNQGSAALAFFMREAFLIGGWTENANDGDADWTAAANHVFTDDAGSPGFAVNAASPREITHSGAPFTQSMVDNGMVIALNASDDQNASMWQMEEYIDTSTIAVNPLGFHPDGWVTESSIPGRILDYGSAIHSSGAWVELDPPSGNNRARLDIYLAYYLECYAQPKAGLGDYTECPSSGVARLYDDDDLAITLNAYFDGNNALFWKYSDNDGRTDLAMWGELDDAAAADTWPGFVLTTTTTDPFPGQLYTCRIDMLGALSTPIQAYTNWLSTGWTADDLTGLDLQNHYRLLNGSPGRARLRKPWVVLDDVVNNGGFVRGTLPILRQTNSDFANWSPLDAGGDWLHLRDGVVAPRNGMLDHLPVINYS